MQLSVREAETLGGARPVPAALAQDLLDGLPLNRAEGGRRCARGLAQRTVQLVIGQILTEQEFRADVLERPIETLTSLRDRGFELTKVDVDALARTDRRFWTVGAEWIDEG
jgi:hypothetical protein